MLQLDKQGLANELLENIEEELKWVLENWKNEVIKYMGFNEFKRNANTDYELERESNMIVAYLKANTYVLADSYGTGSLMLSDNPGFRSYMQSIGKEGGWNPARRGKNIVGHPEGTYTDFLYLRSLLQDSILQCQSRHPQKPAARHHYRLRQAADDDLRSLPFGLRGKTLRVLQKTRCVHPQR